MITVTSKYIDLHLHITGRSSGETVRRARRAHRDGRRVPEAGAERRREPSPAVPADHLGRVARAGGAQTRSGVGPALERTWRGRTCYWLGCVCESTFHWSLLHVAVDGSVLMLECASPNLYPS